MILKGILLGVGFSVGAMVLAWTVLAIKLHSTSFMIGIEIFRKTAMLGTGFAFGIFAVSVGLLWWTNAMQGRLQQMLGQ